MAIYDHSTNALTDELEVHSPTSGMWLPAYGAKEGDGIEQTNLQVHMECLTFSMNIY